MAECLPGCRKRPEARACRWHTSIGRELCFVSAFGELPFEETDEATTDEDEEEDTLHAHTTPEAVYSEEAIKTFIKSKKADVLNRMEKRIEALIGSGWAIKQITGLFFTTYTQAPSRGSSYIPTPENAKKQSVD